MPTKSLTFIATKSSGRVSALLMKPRDAQCLLVLAHGAGAGMKHPFMESICSLLGENHVATFRYQFPYMENGTKRPDPKPVLHATVRSAVEQATKLADGLPIFAGGKSMGGRMTSAAASDSPLEGVKGIIFFGFPLHPAGAPSTSRADHLSSVRVPMLFLQGTRDTLADLSLLKPVCHGLGKKATLHVIDGGRPFIPCVEKVREDRCGGSGRACSSEFHMGTVSPLTHYLLLPTPRFTFSLQSPPTR
ncbi:MAG: alpha/beta family hydrolase [Bacteroidota bacterium]